MTRDKLIVAVIGKDGRTTAIVKALRASPKVQKVILLHDWKSDFPEVAMQRILEKAKKEKPHFVVIGPEEPLAYGVVDELQNKLNIPCIGPVRKLAQLEASKEFTRNLLAEYGIPGNPEFRVFHGIEGLKEYLQNLDHLGGYVVKPDGLTG